PVIGTADVISTVTRRVLSSYHRQMYAGGNVVIAAAGNVEHNRFVRMLNRAQLQQRPPAGGPRVRRPLVKAPPPSFRFAKKDTEQYHVCIGAPGISRSDRRRFAASLLDAILGGSASSRLFQEIREKRGMAYAVYSFASQYTDTGLVGVYLGTREEHLAPCLEIARAREAFDLRDRAKRACLSGGRAAAQPGRARARGVKLALLGDRGKVGRVLAPALEAAGHDVCGIGRGEAIDVEGLDAAIDFTT